MSNETNNTIPDWTEKVRIYKIPNCQMVSSGDGFLVRKTLLALKSGLVSKRFSRFSHLIFCAKAINREP